MTLEQKAQLWHEYRDLYGDQFNMTAEDFLDKSDEEIESIDRRIQIAVNLKQMKPNRPINFAAEMEKSGNNISKPKPKLTLSQQLYEEKGWIKYAEHES